MRACSRGLGVAGGIQPMSTVDYRVIPGCSFRAEANSKPSNFGSQDIRMAGA